VACDVVHGGITRGPRDAKRLALVFTGDTFAEGGDVVLDALAARRAPAAFFLTGNFLRTPDFAPLVRRMVAEGHLVGPHSDRHLLYADWTARDKTLVTHEAFVRDVEDNLRELERFGVARAGVRHWVPPYEWYNAEVARWSDALGLRVFTFTPGPRANADYTGEADRNFVASSTIVANVLARERDDPHGLNGFVLLMHVGAGPGRADKMHARLGELMDALLARGYAFDRADRLLDRCQ
jgi:peptidoglycan/xylan/chitin deacetylase (PgdA/CDA1 family)